MNDLILADRELEVGFIGQLDALLEGIERMDAGHKASPSNEQFLTDKEVSAWLKVSRRTLQDYRNNGMIAYYWKSHATLTLLAKQDCPLWLQYDCPFWPK